jgi:hypothetical protein
MPRLRRIGFVVAVLAVATSLITPTLAWARYRAAGSETNVFATHVLGTPGRPSCSGLGVLTVTLSWAAASNPSYVLSYELGQDSSSGGPYTYTNVGNVTSVSFGVSSGNHYYVVRAVNHNWHGSDSPERRVNGILFLAATCP